MAFPTTSVLDTFTRAAGAPGPNWTFPIWDETSEFTIDGSNEAAFTTGNDGGYWSAATFGPDCEAFADVVSAARLDYLMLRVSPGATANGYAFRSASASIVRVFRLDAGVLTQLGADISWTFSAGDSVGLSAIGSTLSAYQKTGGTWSLLNTRSDGTYSAAGNIGWRVANSSVLADNFGGGTVVAAAPVGTEGQFPVFVGGRGAC